MKLERLQLKLYARTPLELDPAEIIPVFHTFIRDDSLGELLIDVADYTHVHEGPGVVLIGHASDYWLDLGEGRPGLLHFRKRDGAQDPVERLVDAYRRALFAALQIEKELGDQLRFSATEARLVLLDRLELSNDDESFARLKPTLSAALERVYAGVPFELAREGGAKQALTIRIVARGAPDLATLHDRVAS